MDPLNDPRMQRYHDVFYPTKPFKKAIAWQTLTIEQIVQTILDVLEPFVAYVEEDYLVVRHEYDTKIKERRDRKGLRAISGLFIPVPEEPKHPTRDDMVRYVLDDACGFVTWLRQTLKLTKCQTGPLHLKVFEFNIRMDNARNQVLRAIHLPQRGPPPIPNTARS